ncbi:hypothetical protein [Campylobacter jejuni]|uniref:hypothetical protein n=1 Tax=Campylobacter jejuni TaxID=197 RepID=UPI002B231D74|nr:hypothetical protein [Campylobacter jejuni]
MLTPSNFAAIVPRLVKLLIVDSSQILTPNLEEASPIVPSPSLIKVSIVAPGPPGFPTFIPAALLLLVIKPLFIKLVVEDSCLKSTATPELTCIVPLLSIMRVLLEPLTV